MARRFSVQSHTVNGFEIALKFEAEELSEQGLVVTESLTNEINEYFKTKFDSNTDATLEQRAEEIYKFFEFQLHTDPDNVYKNLMGDEYPRVKVVSVDITKNYTASYGD